MGRFLLSYNFAEMLGGSIGWVVWVFHLLELGVQANLEVVGAGMGIGSWCC
jgi:hypothetical protein